MASQVVQVPRRQHALFYLGVAARRNGLDRRANPFIGSWQRVAWFDGWDAPEQPVGPVAKQLDWRRDL